MSPEKPVSDSEAERRQDIDRLKCYVRAIIQCVRLRVDTPEDSALVDKIAGAFENWVFKVYVGLNETENHERFEKMRERINNVNIRKLTDMRPNDCTISTNINAHNMATVVYHMNECIFNGHCVGIGDTYQHDWQQMIGRIYDMKVVDAAIKLVQHQFARDRSCDDCLAPRQLLDLPSSHFKGDVFACALDRHEWSKRCLTNIEKEGISRKLDEGDYKEPIRMDRLHERLDAFAKNCAIIKNENRSSQFNARRRKEFFDEADWLMEEVAVICGYRFGDADHVGS